MVPPQGLHLGGQNGTKIDPKTIKNRSEKSRVKKIDPRRSWVRLEPIMSCLGCHLEALETLWHYACRCFVKIHFFDVKTVRRRFRGQLGPKKAPRGPKMTPKRDPRSTPKRPKTDIKIDLNFNAKTKRVGQGSTRRLWAGTSPQGSAPGALGGGPGGTGAAPRHPCARYTSIHYTVYSIQGT